MIKRMVYVDRIELISVLIASVATIGDVYRAAPRSKVLAVQKEGPEFISGRFKFEDYPIFSRESSPPLPPITINTYTYHTSPIIVDEIDVTGVSTAGVFQVGGIDHIDAHSRTKHFRILQDGEPS
ncbi:spore germination protein GerPE [Halobacillus mangrovi]|uniref:spore germination protein GerPE n=1 Tax=Halobacillus mangrovi TaxID=402384 RepID=UPI003D95B085